jgi:hypothetical protein
LDNTTQSVLGDVILAASIVNYAGGFAYSYRRQLIEKWQKLALKPQGLSTTGEF